MNKTKLSNPNALILASIGTQIKEIRKQKGYTIQDLANATGISKGMLSKVENGRTIPSLSSLFSITSALKIDLSLFFNNIESNNSLKYQIKRKHEYSQVERENALGFLYNVILDYEIGDLILKTVTLELAPNSQREKVSTDGYELKYILEGEVEYHIGDEKVTLYEGDTILFDGRIPHVPVNLTQETAKMFVIYLLLPSNSNYHY